MIFDHDILAKTTRKTTAKRSDHAKARSNHMILPRWCHSGSCTKEGGKVDEEISWHPFEDSDGLEIAILSVQLSYHFLSISLEYIYTVIERYQDFILSRQ